MLYDYTISLGGEAEKKTPLEIFSIISTRMAFSSFVSGMVDQF